MIAVALTVLFGVAGLAVDVGNVYTTRRAMQTAADAAAIAAANTLQGSDSDDYATVAQNVASLNGFTNGSSNVTVTVGTPAACPGASSQSCVQVSVTDSVPTYFLQVLGYSSMSVSTQAIAGGTNSPACIYALDPTDSKSMEISGAFNFSASCGAVVDSSSSSGLYLDGAGTFKTTGTGVAGSSYTDSGAITMSPTPVTGVLPESDPLASLPEPTFSTCTYLTPTTGSYTASGTGTVTVPANTVDSGGISISGAYSTVTFPAGNYGNTVTVDGAISSMTFNPGQYQGASGTTNDSINISAAANTTFADGTYTFCGPVVISGANSFTLSPGVYEGGIQISGAANVTFNSGTYILAGGGLSVTGAATVNGTGVMFYDTSGGSKFPYAAITMNGASGSTLSAPTSGTYKGILFFADRSVASGTAGYVSTGASTVTTNGVWYFPTTTVDFNGASGGSGYTSIIAYQIDFVGASNTSIGSDYSSLENGTSPISSSTLYE